jgi:hypothetical protein
METIKNFQKYLHYIGIILIIIGIGLFFNFSSIGYKWYSI